MRWEGRGGGEGRFSVAFCRLVYLLDEASACPYMEQHCRHMLHSLRRFVLFVAVFVG